MIEILVDGRGAREVDLGCPKCSDAILVEICTIVMVFDDRNIGGRKYIRRITFCCFQFVHLICVELF